ncbi:hypothetical protein E2C01_088604 [Portunus trituberculatus]|uniref:Uncharacterized protein n=1 Tax=Portunus trituberculatus TaxID=210409 RepID=A0A5B7JH08_PORTR|nr:hypothetical protein [Portunus trituberculatus]
MKMPYLKIIGSLKSCVMRRNKPTSIISDIKKQECIVILHTAIVTTTTATTDAWPPYTIVCNGYPGLS